MSTVTSAAFPSADTSDTARVNQPARSRKNPNEPSNRFVCELERDVTTSSHAPSRDAENAKSAGRKDSGTAKTPPSVKLHATWPAFGAMVSRNSFPPSLNEVSSRPAVPCPKPYTRTLLVRNSPEGGISTRAAGTTSTRPEVR